ncbi:hypothetical protein C7974DRAFT_66081 [Boeremia exigua]|uniref:uncharacterized protein n=1 Tax=Boeremia exigua TaxID=749465 RepID=UPI001E8E8B6F|nr:uncharacterized protein C7974DRAFT_66081 [Boeremia exigua]KAH6613873.1 hypothetical protein C7974DRAFT_66081 [Boeremia exigua]
MLCPCAIPVSRVSDWAPSGLPWREHQCRPLHHRSTPSTLTLHGRLHTTNGAALGPLALPGRSTAAAVSAVRIQLGPTNLLEHTARLHAHAYHFTFSARWPRMRVVRLGSRTAVLRWMGIGVLQLPALTAIEPLMPACSTRRNPSSLRESLNAAMMVSARVRSSVYQCISSSRLGVGCRNETWEIWISKSFHRPSAYRSTIPSMSRRDLSRGSQRFSGNSHARQSDQLLAECSCQQMIFLGLSLVRVYIHLNEVTCVKFKSA